VQEALSLYNDKLTRIHMLSANICDDGSTPCDEAAAGSFEEKEAPLQSPAQREMAAFVQTYSSNSAAVNALAGLIVMPPISAGRQLPPDTEELLARAKLGMTQIMLMCWTMFGQMVNV
jgi:hypothetical protein